MKRTSFAAVIAVIVTALIQIAARPLGFSRLDAATAVFIAAFFSAIATFNSSAFVAAAAAFVAVKYDHDGLKMWPAAFVVIAVIGFMTHAAIDGKSELEKGLRYALVAIEGAAIVGELLAPGVATIIGIASGGSVLLAAIGYLGRAS